jgi:hypothetical protein
MKKINIITFAILPLLTCLVLSRDQNNEKRPLPELTVEQKWQKLLILFFSFYSPLFSQKAFHFILLEKNIVYGPC